MILSVVSSGSEMMGVSGDEAGHLFDVESHGRFSAV